MSSLSISAAWDETRAILMRDGKLLATLALALIVFPEAVFAVIGAPVGPQSSGLSFVTYVVVVLLGAAAQIALNRLAIGPGVTVGSAIATGFRRLPSIMVVGVLLAIALMIVAVILLLILSGAGLMAVPKQGQAPPASLLLLLIAMVVLAFAVFQLVFPVAAVETGNPFRLISRAWALSRHNYLRLLGFVAIVFVGLTLIVLAVQRGLGSVILLTLGKPDPGSLSALALGIISGLVQAGFTIVTAVMIARIYLQLAGRHEAQARVPKSGI
jgi:hypothetical protein